MDHALWKTAIKPFACPDNPRAAAIAVLNFALYFFAATAGVWSLSHLPWLTPLAIVTGAAATVRIFSAQHDCGHGSFFSSRFARNLLGTVSGFFTLTAYASWRKVHAIHHKEAGNLSTRDTGDFPLWTCAEYANKSKKEQRQYRLMRHPITIVGIAPVLVFFVAHRFHMMDWMPIRQRFRFSGYEQRSVWINNLGILALIALWIHLAGWQGFLLIQLPIWWLSVVVGSMLFFVHHQYENTYWHNTPDYYQVAMQGSSFWQLPDVLSWCVGYTNYHHLHHLSPLIPSYKLKACHEALPQFHGAPTLSLWEGLTTFKYALWDEQHHRLVPFKQQNSLTQ